MKTQHLVLQQIRGLQTAFLVGHHQDQLQLLPQDSYLLHLEPIQVDPSDSLPQCVELLDLSQHMVAIVDLE